MNHLKKDLLYVYIGLRQPSWLLLHDLEEWPKPRRNDTFFCSIQCNLHIYIYIYLAFLYMYHFCIYIYIFLFIWIFCKSDILYVYLGLGQPSWLFLQGLEEWQKPRRVILHYRFYTLCNTYLHLFFCICIKLCIYICMDDAVERWEIKLMHTPGWDNHPGCFSRIWRNGKIQGAWYYIICSLYFWYTHVQINKIINKYIDK